MVKKSTPRVTVRTHGEEPDTICQRIHIDYAGPYQDHYFLIIVDAKSKWIEVSVCASAPSSYSTIQTYLQEMDVMVSDNTAIFKSDEFQTFGTNSGIFQKIIAPGHPAT